MPETKVVKIQRGKYSPHLQLVRASLSAASAMLSINNRDEVVKYLEQAIDQLRYLVTQIRKAA